jgi:hypothetical protein
MFIIREHFPHLRCLHKYSGSDWDMRSAKSPAPRADLARRAVSPLASEHGLLALSRNG